MAGRKSGPKRKELRHARFNTNAVAMTAGRANGEPGHTNGPNGVATRAIEQASEPPIRAAFHRLFRTNPHRNPLHCIPSNPVTKEGDSIRRGKRARRVRVKVK